MVLLVHRDKGGNNMTTITKQTKYMGTLVFHEVDYQTAKEMTIKNHYSHTWNTAFGKINIGVFRDNELLGVAVFGNLMNPKSYRKIADIEQNNIIELNRLWISDNLGHNAETITLGACWKILRKDYPHIKLVQSFADGRLGCGTIYKASNFKYYGFTRTQFIKDTVTNNVYHSAVFNDGRRINQMMDRNKIILDNHYVSFKVKTYRYLYVLDKTVNIHLKEKVYPKYDKGIERCEYIYPDNLLGKLYWVYTITGQQEYAHKAYQLIKTDKHKIIADQYNHKAIVNFRNTLEKSNKTLIEY